MQDGGTRFVPYKNYKNYVRPASLSRVGWVAVFLATQLNQPA